MALLAIEGMEFQAYHGVYAEEQLTGGRYTVDVYVELPSGETGRSDDLADTVNYEDIHRVARDVMSEPSHLIEHVARKILDTLLEALDIQTGVKVRVRKHHPPLPGVVEQTYVEISS